MDLRSLWEPSLGSVFSAALNDGVLERLLAMLGPGERQFVEIGTQLGDQCNTRYLRARHGFHGWMIDDNFHNKDAHPAEDSSTVGVPSFLNDS